MTDRACPRCGGAGYWLTHTGYWLWCHDCFGSGVATDSNEPPMRHQSAAGRVNPRPPPPWAIAAAHAAMDDDSEHIRVVWSDYGTDGPGWYAYDSEYPDEGSVFLEPPTKLGNREPQSRHTMDSSSALRSKAAPLADRAKSAADLSPERSGDGHNSCDGDCGACCGCDLCLGLEWDENGNPVPAMAPLEADRPAILPDHFDLAAAYFGFAVRTGRSAI
jgi:hypothetical protein